MRLVQFALPADDRSALLEVLDTESVDYVLLDAEDETVVQFPVPAQAVEPVLSDLRDAGLDDRYLVVTSAEIASTEDFDDLESRFVAGSEADESIDPSELAAKAHDMTPNAVTYYSMTLLSAVVAVAGLLLDSAALVVGSMVIAPQVGSALTAAVGVVLADNRMVRSGLRTQIVGLLAAILGAAAVGWLVQFAGFVPGPLDVSTVNQISQRISPGALSLAVGLAAGAAGSLGLATALPVSLVGVMVAAALIPAAATVGIGLAWNLPVIAAGAALMLVANFTAINVVAPAVLWLLDYRPTDLGSVSRRQYLQVAAVLVVLVAVFAGALALTAEQMAYERNANRAVSETLESGEYDDLELVSVQTTVPLLAGDYGVTVIVERPANRPYPELPGQIQQRLADRIGRADPVTVKFVDMERVAAERTAAQRVATERASVERAPPGSVSATVGSGDPVRPESYATRSPFDDHARLAAR